MRTPRQLLVGATALLALAATTQAQQKTWHVSASGAEEVPPVNTNATATGTVTLNTDTNELSWNISHTGLTGAHNASHFHGPAGIGQNAGIQVNIGTGNPIVGSTFISAAQRVQLDAGMWYLNLHSGGFPSGEVRGQVDDVVVETHCLGLANSASAAGARLVTEGDFVAANNALTFTATDLPTFQFGYLLIGMGDQVVNPPGSQGQLCLAGDFIGRFTNDVQVSDANGEMVFTPDILNLPTPPGGSVSAGETWRFQAWYRDIGGNNNFTDALSVSFL